MALACGLNSLSALGPSFFQQLDTEPKSTVTSFLPSLCFGSGDTTLVDSPRSALQLFKANSLGIFSMPGGDSH